MPQAYIRGYLRHYRSEGDPRKPCVMLSNSLGTDLSMWDAQAEALAQHFHVLRHDTRGHGGSASHAGTAPCTIAMLGQDALDLLDHLAIGKAHFCGLSMGGVTAQWLGVHAPHRLHKLVLANTAGRIGTAQGWLSRAHTVRTGGMAEIAAGAGARWFTPGFIAARPAIVTAMLASLAAQDAEGYAACCEALAGADLRGDIGAISAPTLIIAGSQDSVTTLADARQMQQAIVHAEVATVAASHLSNIEAEPAFTRLLLAFLQA